MADALVVFKIKRQPRRRVIKETGHLVAALMWKQNYKLQTTSLMRKKLRTLLFRSGRSIDFARSWNCKSTSVTDHSTCSLCYISTIEKSSSQRTTVSSSKSASKRVVVAACHRRRTWNLEARKQDLASFSEHIVSDIVQVTLFCSTQAIQFS